MISVDKQQPFVELMHTLKLCPSYDEFRELLALAKKTYPEIVSWLDWWTGTSVSKMIFHCFRTISEDLFRALPKTSNAVESLHENIRAAAGCRSDSSRKFTILYGLNALARYSEVVNKEIDGASRGESLSYGTQQRSRQNVLKYGISRPGHSKAAKSVSMRQHLKALHENDEKAPDNITLLKAAQLKKTKLEQLNFQTLLDGIRFQDKINSYQSTPWSQNSCYLDALVETLYFLFIRNKDRWDRLLDQRELDTETDEIPETKIGLTFLKSVRSRMAAYIEALNVTVLSDRLAIIRDAMIEELSGHKIITRGSYESATEVFMKIVSRTPRSLQALFTIDCLCYRECKNGHIQQGRRTEQRSIILPLDDQEQPNDTRSILPHVLSKLNPLFDTIKTDQLADDDFCEMTPPESCVFFCESRVSRRKIPTNLPEVLIVEEQSAGSDSDRDVVKYSFPAEIHIFKAKKYDKLRYSLVSRVEYQPEKRHYIALLKSRAKHSVHLC